jgi:hypothetical protein
MRHSRLEETSYMSIIRTSIAVAIAVTASSAFGGGRGPNLTPTPTAPVQLRQGCAKLQEVIKRLAGYKKVSSTKLNIGITKEKWAGADGRVDVTLMPDGSACAWRELPPRSASTPTPAAQHGQRQIQ